MLELDDELLELEDELLEEELLELEDELLLEEELLELDDELLLEEPSPPPEPSPPQEASPKGRVAKANKRVERRRGRKKDCKSGIDSSKPKYDKTAFTVVKEYLV